MTELHLALSYEAVRALVHGQELVLDTDDGELRIFMRCSDAAIDTFKTQIERALLRLLPTDQGVH